MEAADALLSVALADVAADSGVGSSQRFLIGQENDAEVVSARALTETGTVYNHDVFLTDQFRDKDLVGFWYVDAWIGVEGTAWSDATDSIG